MNYAKTVRRDNICNLCENTYPSLTWDHVPPKGGLDLSAMEIRSYSNANFNPKSSFRSISQNGLKFRTLCGKCNNEILGSKNDDCFNQLMKDVKQIIMSQLVLPSIITLKTYPTKIIKAVLGHLLASKTDFCKTKLDNITRVYLLDEEAELAKNIHVYWWIFPYDCTIIRNDVLQLNPNTGAITYYSVLKCFPLGFAVSYNCELKELGLIEFTKYNNSNKSCKVDIPLTTIDIKNWDYPEQLRYSGIQLVNTEANDIFASKKVKG